MTLVGFISNKNKDRTQPCQEVSPAIFIPIHTSHRNILCTICCTIHCYVQFQRLISIPIFFSQSLFTKIVTLHFLFIVAHMYQRFDPKT